MAYSATFSVQYSASSDASPAGYKLTITITGVTDFADDKLFLIQAGNYAGVCTIIDLDIVGIVEDPVTKFVRANNFTFWCATAAIRDSVRDNVSMNLKYLCRDKSNTVLATTEIVTVTQ